ncbi:hypothetical protein J2S30_000869 [Herbaspirillum rubrisubalbicans]|nr:hypothetical protein [Herbaspirillum rubrisubalbicans]
MPEFLFLSGTIYWGRVTKILIRLSGRNVCSDISYFLLFSLNGNMSGSFDAIVLQRVFVHSLLLAYQTSHNLYYVK